MVVVWLKVLTKHFGGLDTGRREVGWLELHGGDCRAGRDDLRETEEKTGERRGEEQLGDVPARAGGGQSEEEEGGHVPPSSQSGRAGGCWRQYR